MRGKKVKRKQTMREREREIERERHTERERERERERQTDRQTDTERDRHRERGRERERELCMFSHKNINMADHIVTYPYSNIYFLPTYSVNRRQKVIMYRC